MPVIPANQARGLFNQQLIDVYKQIPAPKNFLKKFFPYKTSNSRYIYWAVRREGEPIAIDVLRGTEGNRNTFSIETDKIVDPPYHNENFDITQTDLYYRAWNSQNVDSSVMADWMSWVLEHMTSLRNKIERAYEKQRADVLQYGKLTLKDGTIIDFKRNAASMVDLGAGNYWDNASVDPATIMNAGAQYLRAYGKADGGNFNVIGGTSAIMAFKNNVKILARGRDFYMKLSDLQMPTHDSEGAAYHGRVGEGDYTFDLWTYPQVFNPAGAAIDGSGTVQFIDPTLINIIPERPHFITGFAGVPMLPIERPTLVNLPTIEQGAYVPYEYMDPRASAWIAGVKSAGVTLPTAIDQMFTAKVIGS